MVDDERKLTENISTRLYSDQEEFFRKHPSINRQQAIREGLDLWISQSCKKKVRI